MTDQELIEAVKAARKKFDHGPMTVGRTVDHVIVDTLEPIIAKREREAMLREFLACIVASDNDPAAFNIRSLIRAFARSKGITLP